MLLGRRATKVSNNEHAGGDGDLDRPHRSPGRKGRRHAASGHSRPGHTQAVWLGHLGSTGTGSQAWTHSPVYTRALTRGRPRQTHGSSRRAGPWIQTLDPAP